MKRVIFAFGLTLSLLSCGQTRADWHSFWDRVHLDFHRMNCWPEPFQTIDRQVTAAPVAAMMNNGWRMQNTVSDQLFDPETQQLTRAGELKVYWILTQNPTHRRTVFVLRAETERASETRLASVEEVVSRYTPQNAAPDVMLTGTVPQGGSGQYYDRIQRGYEQSTPEPRLPRMQTTGSNGN